MTIASIDIGSNTILLLIAEYNRYNDQVEPILNVYRVPRISEGLKTSNPISEFKIGEMWRVLEEYKLIINNYNCEKTIVVATNALRIAKNGSDIAIRISNEFGWDVKIVDGIEEARLSFIGAISNFNELESYSVLDIGGGSTEIVYGNHNKIFIKKSFSIGVVSLTEKYINFNPPLSQEIESMRKDIEENLRELDNSILVNTNMIAVAGTPTTLSCISQGLTTYVDNSVNNSILTRDQIQLIKATISIMKSDEINHTYGEVVKGRADILLSGAMILEQVMKYLNIEKIRVSSRGLRYGVIYDYINQLKI